MDFLSLQVARLLGFQLVTSLVAYGSGLHSDPQPPKDRCLYAGCLLGETTKQDTCGIELIEMDDATAMHLLQRRGDYLYNAVHEGAAAITARSTPHRNLVEEKDEDERMASRIASAPLLPERRQMPITTQHIARHESTEMPAKWQLFKVGDPCLVRSASPWGAVDFLGAATWSWPEAHSPMWLYMLAGLYSSIPAVLVYGLPLMVGGAGSIQMIATAAYWFLVRPAAAALESISLFQAGCPGRGMKLPAAHATAAHFYWAWGLLEIATRRRPLWQRLRAVAALSVILLPIPFAQVALLERSKLQVASGSVLGASLGVGFFLTLHVRILWERLRALPEAPSARMLAHWLQPWDNLTRFWGGSIWPPALAARSDQDHAHGIDFQVVEDATCILHQAAKLALDSLHNSANCDKAHAEQCAHTFSLPTDTGT